MQQGFPGPADCADPPNYKHHLRSSRPECAAGGGGLNVSDRPEAVLGSRGLALPIAVVVSHRPRLPTTRGSAAWVTLQA